MRSRRERKYQGASSARNRPQVLKSSLLPVVDHKFVTFEHCSLKVKDVLETSQLHPERSIALQIGRVRIQLPLK
jgi:hypothetical protein